MSIFLPFGQEVSLAQRARSIPILMSLLYHNDTIIKKEKELLRALLIQFCKLEVVTLISARTILLKLQFSQTTYTFLHLDYKCLYLSNPIQTGEAHLYL